MSSKDEADWLLDWLEAGLSRVAATQRYFTLPSPSAADLVGLWQGRSLPTGHPLDGLLETLGWYGKWVEDPEHVHPLVFRRPSGDLIAIEPGLLPARLALAWPALARSRVARLSLASMAPLLEARAHGAGLERRSLHGRVGMALVYRRQPIIDHLRQVEPNQIIGMMEYKSKELPFFFLLTRNPEARPRACVRHQK